MPFPVDAGFVDQTEQKVGAKFPESFRRRMLAENGGTVEAAGDEWQLHPILDSSDRKRLARTCNDIVRETAECKKWRGFPENGVAIGENGCGDRLVFLVTTPGQVGPAVHVWRHETGKTQVVVSDFGELCG